MIRIESQLTVVGGGMAGISAAITAARQGLKVTLINDRPVLGGNHSSELRVHYNGSTHSASYYARETGLSDEIKLNIFKYNPRYNTKDDYEFTDMALYNMVKEEENIDLFQNTYVDQVTMKEDKIESVIGRQLRTEKVFEFVSPLFVDATGDGVIGFEAGAEFRIGRESKDEFGESLAVDVADDKTMGSCVLFKVGRANKAIPFTKPPFAYDYKKDDILKWAIRPDKLRNLPTEEALDEVDGLWWLSYGGEIDTIKDDAKITEELNKLVYGFWDYVKNGNHYKDTENLYLKWVANMPGKRESRRFIGDHVLSQNDMVNRVDFEDSVSTGGWSLDIHDVAGVYGEGKASEFGEVPALYNIPYRTMYSKNISNLFLAGRVASASHVALGSIRVMQTLATMAQAVGSAAVLCHKYDVLPRAIYSEGHYKELQEILQRDGQYIMGLKEDIGLLQEAKVTASSYKELENTSFHNKYTGELAKEMTLDRNYGFCLPTSTGIIDSAQIYIKNLSDQSQELRVSVYQGSYSGNFAPDEVLNTFSLEVDKAYEGWLTLPISSTCTSGDKLYVTCMANEKLGVKINHQRILGAPSFTLNTKKMRLGRSMEKLKLNDVRENTLCFRNVSPKQDVYKPEYTINGIARPFGLPNGWVSKDEDEAWLQFEFDEPQSIEEVLITFNTQMETNNFSSPIRQMIKDYSVEVSTVDGEVIKKEICDNHQGLNRHAIVAQGVKTIKFNFTQTYGSPFYEVLSVKVF